VLALILPGALRAQDRQRNDPLPFSLEQLLETEVPIVEGASRFTQAVTDAPASITIITHEEIERFGHRTLADVLRSARGFYITYDRNYTYVGTRGLARPSDFNSRILLLIDGHRLNENVFDSALIGTEFPLDLELIDRVEIVRGPSSSLYGSNALFAIVNVITRKAVDAAGTRLSTTAASLGTARVQGSFARVFADRTQLIVGGSGYRSQGDRELTFPDIGAVARDMDRDRATRVFASATRGAWTAQVLAGTRTKRIPTGAYETVFDDTRSETTDDRGFAALKYDGRVGGVSLAAKAAYDWYRYDGAYSYGLDLPLLKDLGYGSWWTFEGLVRRRYRTHTLTGGLEFQDNRQQDQGQYDDEPRLWWMDDRRASRVWGLFAQDEFTVGSKVILNAGLRHDRHSDLGGKTNPRLALIFKPVRTTSLKVLHGTSFRAPNVYERFYYGEMPLRPETIRTTEFVAERYGSNGLRVGASAFVYRVDGLITPRPDGDSTNLTLFNADAVEVAGAEFEAERAWVGGWQGTASLTVQRPVQTPGDGALSNSPQYLGRARLGGPVWPGIAEFGVEALYTSHRHTLLGRDTQGVGLAFATIRTTRAVAGFTFALDIDNLLDRAYADPGSAEHLMELIPQDGRTLALTVRWRF
jgi:iron complex outermembrane receptor protein